MDWQFNEPSPVANGGTEEEAESGVHGRINLFKRMTEELVTAALSDLKDD